MKPFAPAHSLAFVALAGSRLANCYGLSFSSSFYTSLSIITTTIHTAMALNIGSYSPRPSTLRPSSTLPASTSRLRPSSTLPSSTSHLRPSSTLPSSTSHNRPSSTSSSSCSASTLSYSLPRLGLYYQTFHDTDGNPTSLLPLITDQGIAMTHIFIAAFHVAANKSEFHLNDLPPSDPSYETLWSEVKTLQAHGVRVLGMVGGAAPGSFANTTLDAPDQQTFDASYAELHKLAKKYHLNGFDLDVEQSMSQSGIERLINRLKDDFGSDFEVTLAPVATALFVGPTDNLSGFSYNALEADVGGSVAFYNAQFYNGWGDATMPGNFETAVSMGFAADKVCVGVLTSPVDGGSGYIDIPTLAQTIDTLADAYSTPLCGITGWEYFNALPGDEPAPWEWAQAMTAILRPGKARKLRLTRREAEHLTRAWERSKIAPGEDGIRRRGQPSALDYFTLVSKEYWGE